MGVDAAIDRGALHCVFWDWRDENGQLVIRQSELAEQMGVTPAAVSHVITKMSAEGRIARPKGSRGPYEVFDPAGF